MKSRDVLVRLHRFKVEEVQRRLKSLRDMRGGMAQKMLDLEVMMQDEQRRASGSDLGRLAYPTFARSVQARRDNIQRSIDEAERQILAALLAKNGVGDGIGQQFVRRNINRPRCRKKTDRARPRF